MVLEIPEKAHIVIVGSGIIGSSIACHLIKRGVKDVVVLDKGEIGAQGATSACLGGLRTQFSTAINVRFSLISREVFRRFKEEFGVDPKFKPYGYLFLAGTKEQWAVFENMSLLSAELGVPVELLTPLEVSRRWPFLNVEDIVGGSYTKEDGFYGPMEVLQAFVTKARQGGAVFLENVQVIGFSISAKKITRVLTSGGHEIKTDFVINAAGPWAGKLAALAGLELPIGPLKRHLFFTDSFYDIPESFPMILDIHTGWYMKREGQGLILGGPAGEKTFNQHVDFDAEERTAMESVRRVPILEKARIIRGWVGHYELTPDHHAVIGSFPEVENFICAAGFSGHGFQHAPITGKIVAELIVDGRAKTEDIYPLRPIRFKEGDLIYEPLIAFRDNISD